MGFCKILLICTDKLWIHGRAVHAHTAGAIASARNIQAVHGELPRLVLVHVDVNGLSERPE